MQRMGVVFDRVSLCVVVHHIVEYMKAFSESKLYIYAKILDNWDVCVCVEHSDRSQEYVWIVKSEESRPLKCSAKWNCMACGRARERLQSYTVYRFPRKMHCFQNVCIHRHRSLLTTTGWLYTIVNTEHTHWNIQPNRYVVYAIVQSSTEHMLIVWTWIVYQRAYDCIIKFPFVQMPIAYDSYKHVLTNFFILFYFQVSIQWLTLWTTKTWHDGIWVN